MLKTPCVDIPANCTSFSYCHSKVLNFKGIFRAEVEFILITESNEDETSQELLVQLRIGVENKTSCPGLFCELPEKENKALPGGEGERSRPSVLLSLSFVTFGPF